MIYISCKNKTNNNTTASKKLATKFINILFDNKNKKIKYFLKQNSKLMHNITEYLIKLKKTLTKKSKKPKIKQIKALNNKHLKEIKEQMFITRVQKLDNISKKKEDIKYDGPLFSKIIYHIGSLLPGKKDLWDGVFIAFDDKSFCKHFYKYNGNNNEEEKKEDITAIKKLSLGFEREKDFEISFTFDINRIDKIDLFKNYRDLLVFQSFQVKKTNWIDFELQQDNQKELILDILKERIQIKYSDFFDSDDKDTKLKKYLKKISLTGKHKEQFSVEVSMQTTTLTYCKEQKNKNPYQNWKIKVLVQSKYKNWSAPNFMLEFSFKYDNIDFCIKPNIGIDFKKIAEMKDLLSQYGIILSLTIVDCKITLVITKEPEKEIEIELHVTLLPNKKYTMRNVYHKITRKSIVK